MSTKSDPGRFNCYQAAYPDETIFTILARDPAFPATVSFWKQERIRLGKNESEDDIDRLAAIDAEIEAARKWRSANLDPFGDGTPTWKLPHTVPVGPPIRVENAAMDISIKDSLQLLLASMDASGRQFSAKAKQRWEGERALIVKMMAAIDANVPCVPSNWDADKITDQHPNARALPDYVVFDEIDHFTPGEKVVLDSAPEDLAHAPEVPPHRFSMFNKGEHYAYARGLEINPSHLPTALDALLLDGWKLVSLFGQTDSANVGFIFERVPPVIQPTFMHLNEPMSPEFEEKLKEYMTKTPAWPIGGIGSAQLHKKVLPKIEVHLEGMSETDALQAMSVIECRLQWLPNDYESLQVVGLIANDPEAAFDFTQRRGAIAKRKTLIKGNCGDMEFGRQQEP